MSAPADSGNDKETDFLDFSNIKKWIALQEAQQNHRTQPASLTPAQLKAFRELNQAAILALAPQEPKSDKNWVGLLHMYRDAHPDGKPLEFVEEDLGMDPRSGGSLWHSFVTLSEANGQRFPGSHNAVDFGGSLPCFTKKKDAKQYAARCAVEWLMQQQLLPTDGESVVFKRPKIHSSQISSEAPKVVSKGGCKAVAAEPTFLNSEPAQPVAVESTQTDETAKELRCVTRVDQLCNALGYGKPIYVLNQIENTQKYCGWTDWRDEMRVPASVGVIKNVLGKKWADIKSTLSTIRNAKEKMAEQILGHLELVQAKRMEKARAIIGQCQKMCSVE